MMSGPKAPECPSHVDETILTNSLAQSFCTNCDTVRNFTSDIADKMKQFRHDHRDCIEED